MTDRSILISGASVSGPTLACWLAASGWDVTVVERTDALRTEGQNVDVRGVGRQVLRRTGVEELVLAAHTGETGTAFVDDDGRAFASFGAGTDDSGGGTAEVEILRGELARILHERSAGTVRYVFSDQITALHDDGRGVDVEFLHGPGRRFDAVVIAEGLRSRTRELVLPGVPIRELGVYCAYLTVPRTATDDSRWRVYHPGRGRTVSLRPDNVGSTRALLTVASAVRGLDRLPLHDVVSVLRATFADAGWETPRVLDALDNGSMYVEDLGQVRSPTWSRGRVALVGDAAHAATPVSGMGTTLAVTGAYVLAGELAACDDPRDAFARYDRVLRPLVDSAQNLAPGTPGIAHPRSRAEVALLRGVLRLASTPVTGGRLSRWVGSRVPSPAEAITLPDYPMAALRPTG